jgi:hypothetical protein
MIPFLYVKRECPSQIFVSELDIMGTMCIQESDGKGAGLNAFRVTLHFGCSITTSP